MANDKGVITLEIYWPGGRFHFSYPRTSEGYYASSVECMTLDMAMDELSHYLDRLSISSVTMFGPTA